MPLLHILSHDGVLCIFHVINILPQSVPVCEPPKPLADMSGLDQFVVASIPVVGAQTQNPTPPSHTHQSMPSSQASLPTVPTQSLSSSQPVQLFQQLGSSQSNHPPPLSSLFQPALGQATTIPQPVRIARNS